MVILPIEEIRNEKNRKLAVVNLKPAPHLKFYC